MWDRNTPLEMHSADLRFEMPMDIDPATKEVIYETVDSKFLLSWSSNKGFGQFYFYVGHDGKVHIDSETMGKDAVKAALIKMVDDAVMDD